MTLIKCPHCGHTVLSVATVCPTCSSRLSEQHFPLSSGGALTECRRCGHPVYSRVEVCPHCGVRRPSGRRTSPLAYAGLFAAVLVAVTTRVTAPPGVPSPSESPADVLATAPVVAVQAPVATGDSAARAFSASVASDSARSDSVAPDSVPAPPAAVIGEPDSAAARPAATATRSRWAVRWANVRAAPADEAPVVTLLRPGQRVDVGEPRRGWVPIYLDGEVLGYTANGLLASRPLTP